jgi:hypothetical protein
MNVQGKRPVPAMVGFETVDCSGEGHHCIGRQPILAPHDDRRCGAQAFSIKASPSSVSRTETVGIDTLVENAREGDSGSTPANQNPHSEGEEGEAGGQSQ